MRDYSTWVEHINKKSHVKKAKDRLMLLLLPYLPGQRETLSPWEKESEVNIHLQCGPQPQAYPTAPRPTAVSGHDPAVRGSKLAPADSGPGLSPWLQAVPIPPTLRLKAHPSPKPASVMEAQASPRDLMLQACLLRASP